MNLKIIKVITVILLLVLLVNTAFAAVKTFRVQETDFVKVTPQSFDPDHDYVNYNYSQPLDELGEWQTNYGDAGEYNVDITATDGKLETTKTINILVEQKNQPPYLKNKRITANEAELVNLKNLVTDREEDPLTFKFNFPFNKEGEWLTNYDDEGNYIINFVASDGEYSEDFRIEVNILHTNQAPKIINSFSEEDYVEVNENENLLYFVEVIDFDNNNNDNDNDGNVQDENIENTNINNNELDQINTDDNTIDVIKTNTLSYRWELDGKVINEEKSGEYTFSYNSAGEHTLKFEVSDGEKSSERIWNIEVKNVNRKPFLELIPIKVYENEKIIVDVPEKDIDEETLTFKFEEPLNDKGEWQTNYDDAGEYELKITAFDGELKSTSTVKITILNVDRAPILDIQKEIFVKEGETLELNITTEDLDRDNLEVSFENLPADAIYNEDEKKLVWTPSYDYIKRKGGFFSEMLNTLRLEHNFLKTKDSIVTVKSCGMELCSKATFKLTVENVNRAPVFENVEDLYITETEMAKLNILANDPDGDIVRYTFDSPLGKNDGEWNTGFQDAGEYVINVTASDGFLEKTIPITLQVNNKNRLPTLEVNKEKLTVNEGEEFSLVLEAFDPDNDNLTITVKDLPEGASFNNGIFVWAPAYSTIENKTDSSWNAFLNQHTYLNKKLNKEKATRWLEFVASDGEFEVINPIQVTIKNMNQAPEIIDYIPVEEITVNAYEPVIFHVATKDADNDELSYKWNFGLGEKEVTGTDTIERTFTSPGKKKIKVTISDGREDITKLFKVQVVKQEFVEEVINTIDQPPLSFKVMVIKG
ncbi:MAG: PKD domain-containing protein [Candidatus Woesearchaeota archaeon]